MKALEKKRGKNHPRGRAISLMEMIQVMPHYPQVHTDMVFENVPTLPLEQRAGVECSNECGNTNRTRNDGDDLIPLSHQIRSDKELPDWRQNRYPKLLILQGVLNSPISVDKITRFSVRPPELRHIIRTVGHYYRWFYTKNKRMDREKLENVIDLSVKKCMWVDGLQFQVFLRVKAFPEIR